MEKLVNGTYEGERALFKGKNLDIENCLFQNGESPLKESRNIKLNNSTFSYKYPLWYSKNVEVKNTTFEVMSRSGIWYTEDITLTNCNIIAPKEFRRSKNITIVDSIFHDAQETLWNCENITMKNVNIDNLVLNGNYVLDGAKDIVVKNSILNAKDSFWNCENV